MSDLAGDLRSFLRDARARLTPAEVGLPVVTRRRTPGLRREEVAELAGISEAWYTRFERGETQLSLKALRRVASALRLDAAATTELLRLNRPEIRETDSPSARAERSCVRVGTFDLPVAQQLMLRGAAAVACTPGLAMEHIPRSWMEQAPLLERGEVDLAITYRFAGCPTPPELEEAVFGEEIGSHAVVAPALGFRGGAIRIDDVAGATLCAPPGRIGDELFAHGSPAECRPCVAHRSATMRKRSARWPAIRRSSS